MRISFERLCNTASLSPSAADTQCLPCFEEFTWAWFPEPKGATGAHRACKFSRKHSVVDGHCCTGVGASLENLTRAHSTAVILTNVASGTFANLVKPTSRHVEPTVTLSKSVHSRETVKFSFKAFRWPSAGPLATWLEMGVACVETSWHNARQESRAALASILVPRDPFVQHGRTCGADLLEEPPVGQRPKVLDIHRRCSHARCFRDLVHSRITAEDDSCSASLASQLSCNFVCSEVGRRGQPRTKMSERSAAAADLKQTSTSAQS